MTNPIGSHFSHGRLSGDYGLVDSLMTGRVSIVGDRIFRLGLGSLTLVKLSQCSRYIPSYMNSLRDIVMR